MNAIAFRCSHCQYIRYRPESMWTRFALSPDHIHFSMAVHPINHRIGAATGRLNNAAARSIGPLNAQTHSGHSQIPIAGSPT